MSRLMTGSSITSFGSVVFLLINSGLATTAHADSLSSLQGAWVITSASARPGQPTLGDWIEVKDKRVVVSWGPPMRLEDSRSVYDSDVVWRSGSVSCYYRTVFTSQHLTLRVTRSEPTPDDCLDQALLEKKPEEKKPEPGQSASANPSAGVKLQDRPIPAAPQIPSVGYTGATLWWHNGSQVELRNDGARGRWFYYYRPSDRMASLVSKGTLLFNGERKGNTYVGTIRRFHPSCGTMIYPVQGETFDGDPPRVVLRGRYQPFDSTTCDRKAYVSEDLTFVYFQRSPSDEKSSTVVSGER
jgi:hypothetical protein